MDRKFLEGLGIDKDNVEKIMVQYGTDITGYQTQIQTKDATIKALRDDVIKKDGRIAELEKIDVEDLKTQLQNEKDGREKDKKEFTLRSLLQQEGCKDVDYLLYKLGDTVEFDDKGAVKDSENFIKATKEKYAGQFEEGMAGGTGSAGNFGRTHKDRTPLEKNPYSQKGWNLTEQMKLEMTDPDRAKKLKEEAKAAE
ncbi:hypothetical protein H8S37_12700 [Mediterraneibacter sp. NSJ-55]|uniref:Phage minor structural protein GP20 n=1 Tax=Mediterraneibacter hominis TaxID=2763054 RepID=A0A923RSY6_9FIRM|nr:hypothetical protein [Mediterraneibacter hominis]MBC5689777.1 hypothetical protein [Mediterraneibacter hominis]